MKNKRQLLREAIRRELGVCTACGGQKEAACPGDLCYGCQLDTFIPRGYANRENYKFREEYGYTNATTRPPTGVSILDDVLSAGKMMGALRDTKGSKRPR